MALESIGYLRVHQITLDGKQAIVGQTKGVGVDWDELIHFVIVMASWASIFYMCPSIGVALIIFLVVCD